MARGWESKAVEGQMEEAEERALRPLPEVPDSPTERARLERLEALRMSQSRTAQQLKTARTVAHRTMLERALAHLESQIKELSGK